MPCALAQNLTFTVSLSLATAASPSGEYPTVTASPSGGHPAAAASLSGAPGSPFGVPLVPAAIT